LLRHLEHRSGNYTEDERAEGGHSQRHTQHGSHPGHRSFAFAEEHDHDNLEIVEGADDAGQHATTLSPIEQDVIFKHLEDMGFTYERLSTVYESRAAYNLWSYGVINALVDAVNGGIYKGRVRELF